MMLMHAPREQVRAGVKARGGLGCRDPGADRHSVPTDSPHGRPVRAARLR